MFNLKGEFYMVAMLWANQIILGNKTYTEVPRLLKAKVKEILIEAGCSELVTEEVLLLRSAKVLQD